MRSKQLLTYSLIACLSAAMFVGFRKAEVYSVKLPRETWIKHLNKLTAVRQVLDESNLPNQAVKFSVNSIDSLIMDIYNQLPDSIKSYKPKKP